MKTFFVLFALKHVQLVKRHIYEQTFPSGDDILSFVCCSLIAVSVLCVVCGETRHPNPSDRGQDGPGQQHSLPHTVQTSADAPRSGE